jgi:hypothetical protein
MKLARHQISNYYVNKYKIYLNKIKNSALINLIGLKNAYILYNQAKIRITTPFTNLTLKLKI